MVRYRGYEEINSDLEGYGGLMSVSMQELRDAQGVFRLGTHVRRSIHNKLQSLGIGHLPRELPEYQEHRVRLYKLGSPIAQNIEDILNPTEEADERLRQTFASEYEEVIQKIRELVCE